MRVLVAPDSVGPVDPRELTDPDELTGDGLGAAAAAAELIAGWSQARPEDQLTAHPLSAGGSGFLDVLRASLGGTPEAALARSALEPAQPTSWLRVGATGYLEAGPLLGSATSPHARRLAEEGGSAGVGELLTAALRAGVRRLVVGVGETGSHDGGLGMLRTLAGLEDDAPIGEVVRAAHAALRGTELLVAVATDLPLLGLSGAGAALAGRPGLDAEVAQRLERRVAGPVARIEEAAELLTPAAPSLLAGPAGSTDRRISRRAGAGAGGGLAFALAAIGGRMLPGADVVAVETGLGAAVTASELVVTACTSVGGAALASGVVGVVGRTALGALVPAVAVAPIVAVRRRELAGTGLEAAYPLLDPPAAGQGRSGPGATLAQALSHRASRVARTWSR